MYRPQQFCEDRRDILLAAISQIQFATLVSLSNDALVASHIPMLIKQDSQGVRLEGHVARANEHWTAINGDVASLAIFTGPHNYISPTWYTSKVEHQKVVPTWNYICVQAGGPLSVVQDQQWLLRHVTELTEYNETQTANPWKVSDAPSDFIDKLCAGIVGLTLQVETLEGVWKMAQHKSGADRAGVIDGLQKTNTSSSQHVAAEMQRLEDERRRNPNL